MPRAPFSSEQFRYCLKQALPPEATSIAVAVSGGADSARLLAAVSLLPAPARGRLPLRALHVDHALQPAAARLRRAALSLCESLQVPLQVLEIRVDCAPGESLEAAARTARYRALGAALAPGECLLTAHHQQDQAETVLLQLLRGAGVAGLAGMPRCRPLGAGWHVRPLLEVSRAQLCALYANRTLIACEDPMNADPRFDRVFLRQELWPLLESRWPGAARTLARSATHVGEAQSLLARHARDLLERLRDGDALDVKALRGLDELERAAVLREFIAAAGARMPSSARLHEALRQVLEARADRIPAVVWEDRALRRYRDRLYVTPARPARLDAHLAWAASSGAADLEWPVLELPQGLGRLRFERAPGGLDPQRLPRRLEVRGRAGHETLRIAPGGRSRSVRELMQAFGVRPWMRDALPFIRADGTLLAVGDLWHNSDMCVAPGETGLRCRWDEAPAIL